MENKISKTVEKKLLEIAKRNSVTIEERGSLERRYSDNEDFLDIAVWSIQQMLEDAYELGRATAKEGK